MVADTYTPNKQEPPPPYYPTVVPPPSSPTVCTQVIQTRKGNKSNCTNLSISSLRQQQAQRQRMRELEEGDVTFFEAVLVWLSKVDITVSE